jgi:NADH:ubiquinone reductase (H+-translocating)
MSNDVGRTSPVPHVVCLGGGYVAIYLAKALRRHVRAGRVRLTVVDLENFQCFHGLIPEMLTGKIQPTDTLSPARRLFAPGDFVNAEVEDIDLEGKQVTVARLLDGRRLTIPYDHLVLGLGSTEHMGRFPGLAEHSFRLKAYSGCLAVRNHVINMLELADMERDPVERRRLLNFVIVGGNYAGVEVAGEFREFLPVVARKHFPNIPVDEIKITLVVSGDHILPELHTHKPKLVAYAQAQLAKDRHLEVLYGERLASATVEEAVLRSGDRIPTRTIISCTGNSTIPVLDPLPLPKNERGRIVTDRYAKVEGADNVWAGGDCAAVPLADGTTAPALAIWAMTVGELIGKNIVRQEQGKELRPYRFDGLGDACVVGNHKAVAHLKGISIRGFPAWVIWRMFMILYLPSPEKKVRVMWNWMMAPFFGRDLVNMRVHQPLDLAPMIFEPGQDIVRKGEVGNSLFIIQDGEVEVLDEPDAPPLAVLGRGQHFGEIAVFEQSLRTATVRARTPVKVLQVRRDAARALSDSIDVVGDTLRTRPESSLN